MIKANFKQEKYKMFRQNTVWYGLLALFLLLCYSFITTPHPSKEVFITSFGTGQWVTIIIIAISSSFVSMEYTNNTMNTLLYKSKGKFDVYFSKLLVVMIYGITLILVGNLLSIGIQLFLKSSTNQRFDVFSMHELMKSLLLNDLGSIVYLMFIVTLSFLLISWIKNNAVVIGIGLVIGFMGSTFSGLMLSAFPDMKGIMALNPLNMINITTQLSDPRTKAFAGLSNSQLIMRNVAYATVFTVIGYMVFKRRYD